MKRLINHQNIIKFHSYYHESDTFMMIMEYFHGINLLDMILSKKITIENDIKLIFQQITFALYYLHCCNIIHRDVKPENILISYDKQVSSSSLSTSSSSTSSSFYNIDQLQSLHNTISNNNKSNNTINNSSSNNNDQNHHINKYHVKLLDFGLSINNGNGSNAKTFVGTPCYVAPEVQYNSGGSYDSSNSSSGSGSYSSSYSFPVDCWSLGAVLYVMLVARFPEFEVKNYHDCNNSSSRDDYSYNDSSNSNNNIMHHNDDDDDKHKKVVVKLPSSLFQYISYEAQDLITS